MQDTSSLLWGLVFGAVGFGFLTYGRKQKAVVPLVTGIALILIPYFFTNVYLLVATGIALMATPWFIRI